MDDNKQYLSESEAICQGIPLGIPMVGTEKNREEENSKEKNREEKKKKEKEIDDFFESVWKLYIRKEGKSSVTKKAKEEIFNIGYDKMKKAIEKYNNKVKDSETRYQLMGSTFFNGRFRDYLESEATELPVVNTPPVEAEDEKPSPEWQGRFV